MVRAVGDGVGLHHPDIGQVPGAPARLFEQGRAQIDQFDRPQTRQPLAQKLQVAPGAGPQFDDAGAGLRGQPLHQFRASVQQAFTEGIVMGGLGSIEGLQPFGQSAAARLAAHQPPQDLGIAGGPWSGTDQIGDMEAGVGVDPIPSLQILRQGSWKTRRSRRRSRARRPRSDRDRPARRGRCGR